VYVESGKKRTFAAVIEWPGWSRSGPDEQSALEALLAYFPRYRAAVGGAAEGLVEPSGVDRFKVEERVGGDATTDFGTPGQVPSADGRPLAGAELRRQLAILEASWKAFDASARAAAGRELTTGPRGGGRSLEKIRAHVDEADLGYLSRLGGRLAPGTGGTEGIRSAFVDAVEARARGDVPDLGPRGGRRWPARYGIRRAAWHALDHAWEIEDRAGTRRP